MLEKRQKIAASNPINLFYRDVSFAPSILAGYVTTRTFTRGPYLAWDCCYQLSITNFTPYYLTTEQSYTMFHTRKRNENIIICHGFTTEQIKLNFNLIYSVVSLSFRRPKQPPHHYTAISLSLRYPKRPKHFAWLVPLSTGLGGSSSGPLVFHYTFRSWGMCWHCDAVVARGPISRAVSARPLRRRGASHGESVSITFDLPRGLW